MKIILAALMIAFLASCNSLEGVKDMPVNYTKYNDRDNIGEVLDDGYFHFEKFCHSIEYQEVNGLDLLFYPFKKNELRSGSPLIYR